MYRAAFIFTVPTQACGRRRTGEVDPAGVLTDRGVSRGGRGAAGLTEDGQQGGGPTVVARVRGRRGADRGRLCGGRFGGDEGERSGRGDDGRRWRLQRRAFSGGVRGGCRFWCAA